MPENENAYIALLRNAEDGVLLGDLETALRGLVRTLKTTYAARGGTPKGALQLTIVLAYDGKVIDTAAAITAKEPKRLRPRSVMYATRDDGISPVHPSQVAMEFGAPRAVAAAPLAATPDQGDVRRALTVT